jgi:hypothetical protein
MLGKYFTPELHPSLWTQDFKSQFSSFQVSLFLNFIAFFFFVVLEFELRAFTLSHSLFAVGIFEIRSQELFARTGFELQSS